MKIGKKIRLNKYNRLEDMLKKMNQKSEIPRANIFDEIFTLRVNTLNNITIRINNYIERIEYLNYKTKNNINEYRKQNNHKDT